ncbi:MAG: tRNA/rRNA cytosine-C5-methylase, partial [Candidatus Nanopelagicaceae bacterium]
PCSGIGALRRRPELRWRRSLNDVKNLAILQSELLQASVNYLNPGGLIAYVTCSPHLHETKSQIRSFLKRNPNFSIVPITAESLDARFKDAVLDDGTMQLWTHKHQTDSMYLALLKRND